MRRRSKEATAEEMGGGGTKLYIHNGGRLRERFPMFGIELLELERERLEA
jgi:hypothetical protein